LPAKSRYGRVPLYLFIWSLLLPATLMLGPLAVSPYRIVLLVYLVPCFVSWSRGGAGKIQLSDLLLLAFCIWCLVCLSVKQGMGSSIATFGMQFTETMGAYLLARCLIRTPDDFLALAQTVFWVLLVLLPVAIVEAISGQNLARELISYAVASSAPIDDGTRLGLHRVQSVLPHPILFGVLFSSCLSLVILVFGYGASMWSNLVKGSLIAFGTFLSLSSAPIGSLVIQLMLLTWDRLFKAFPMRWGLLIGLVLFFMLVIGLVSNQGVVGVYVTYLTFNAHNGFYRMAIWEYGSASVMNNPLFGVGYGEWERPWWMASSMDNFWLVNAVRWGAVGGGLLLAAVVAMLLRVAFTRHADQRIGRYKLAYFLAIFVHIFAGWTVHFWGSSYVFFMFLLGSGGCFVKAVERGKARHRQSSVKALPRKPEIQHSLTRRQQVNALASTGFSRDNDTGQHLPPLL